jgi:hypothetical protein
MGRSCNATQVCISTTSFPLLINIARHAIEAVDRCLRDIRSENKPFGGITVVFGGDYQQTLPIVPHGSPEDIINATLQRSYLWSSIFVLRLRVNMRVQASVSNENTAFANWLTDIGHGHPPSHCEDVSSVRIPEVMRSPSIHHLITWLYSSPQTTPSDSTFFRDRVILSARNEDVIALNNNILNIFPGQSRTYPSADCPVWDVPPEDRDNDIPPELLNSFDAPGFPPAHLTLKLGCPIILLRNLDSKQGLCNGTRATVKTMSDRVIEVRLMGGERDGETAFIPRISLSPSIKTERFTVKMKRRQFPIRLAFAMTINKSQGQSLKQVGIDLSTGVFAHGQLYVALSRATSPNHIKIVLPEDECEHTPNIVYETILL